MLSFSVVFVKKDKFIIDVYCRNFSENLPASATDISGEMS